MSDLVKRLRVAAQRIRKQVEHLGMKLPSPSIEEEAAALIESQAERIKALEAGLDPFADAYLRKRIEYAKRYGADVEIGFKNFDKMPDKWKMEGITFSMGTFRHAASLLEAKP